MNKKKGILLFIITLLIFFLLYSVFNYKHSLNKFKKAFNNAEYNEAYTIINKNSWNPINLINKNKDIEIFLSNHLEELNHKFLSNNISQEEFLIQLTQIEQLGLLQSQILSFKNNLPLVANSKENFDKAIEMFNKEDYDGALNYLNKINLADPNYKEILKYKNECIKLLKNNILNKANKYADNSEYSKGITLIEENLDKFNHDIDLINKLDELENLRINYLNEYSKNNINKKTNRTKPVLAYYNQLNTSTINEFGINSLTNHLVFVNISEQKTYIFNGTKDKWSLEKEFLCSTGIEGKETPVGEFKVETRAPWFFSEKYGQGGKYYVQFMGNYLFHSIPFDRDQETILDYTLGEPASHGCIRLAVDDAKWLYDNVKDGSKIIIY
ncbi:L,D-transpeptidase [Clostridium tarantellae]|uniref:L,D-transpeptidase family protein n=1 Tax=Clostridium tarantellae TaxID=39493 RepID=A0A6I1MK63_9CLOT|nr:L,D-transpeptidase [Clostridium tarantellae]MPQ42562.1 L,D-transpeptidase family protein [Clostridium tarantellae]